MLRIMLTLVLAVGFVLVPSISAADELKKILEKVEQYVADENYAKALEELGWAKKELEGKYNEKLAALLPDTLADFTGAKTETNSVMGFTTISRIYSNSGNSFRLELQSSSGSAGGGLGGFAALGQMAAMFGQQAGQSSLRINGRTANLQEENGEMVIYLDGGSMINIKRESGKINFKTIAEAIDLDAVEKQVKGSK
ncbi:MAG TPA: hypothetical protein PKA63_09620 [Oligoflexia bacterium]|nr:hypothetical protein [Oligoflexia bacterium]HMP48912.1 hypothetical protein [Oligoflexia bacterium]